MNTPVIDLHCDLLYKMRHAALRGTPLSFESNNRHIDLQKLKRGNYLLQCFAAFVDMGESENPLVIALEKMDILHHFCEQYSDSIHQVKTWADLESIQREGKIGAMLTIEDGGCCQGNLSVLREFYRLGVRMMTLTWNYENTLGYPHCFTRSPENSPERLGLKERGFEFLHEMERLGIIADVSHLSDEGFWDVVNHATRPFVASHSNSRAVCPNSRNLTDDMLRAIAAHGGLLGINYCPIFLDPNPDYKQCKSSTTWMAMHIKHIRQVAGIDCIALGSDYDGIGGLLEITDCSQIHLLEDELRRQGMGSADVEKIFHANALRLFKEMLP